jgi:hypothetical protein
MHAYGENEQGEPIPVYDIEGKNGNMRPTRVADMPVFDLVPSVTEVNSAVLVNYFLQQWKLEELAKWCALNPIGEESQEEYVKKALEGGATVSRNAMDFGTIFHDTAEKYAFDRNCEIPIEVYPFWPTFKAWFDENIVEVIAVEKPVVCRPFGIGGKLDMIAVHKQHGLITCDFKTQGVKTMHLKRGDEKRITWYDSWVCQLALYSAMLDITTQPPEEQEQWARDTIAEGLSCCAPKCLSVVIDSKEPGLVEEKLWPPEKADWGLRLALQCIRVWQTNNNYEPKGSIL